MMDTCGAKTRAGTPCRQKTIYWNGRCKFHGGMATGPKTDAGKEQSRINGRKGGRPRKDAAGKTEVMEPLQNTAIQDAQVSARVLSDVSILEAATDCTEFAVPVQLPQPETEVVSTDKSVVPAQFAGEVLGRVAEPEMSSLAHVYPAPDQPDSGTEKPKSWMLKEVKVLAVCERCTMFAGSGACLAVAKGIIPSMPSSGDCPGFIDFETA
jgi:hypothetical protein